MTITYTRGVDWGAYCLADKTIQIPWKQMIEKAGVQFFVCKGCQEDLANGYSTLVNLQAARDAGVKINGTYYWSFGYGNVKYYIDQYSKSIDSENPDFIMVDIEQFDDGNGGRIDPKVLSDYGQALCEGLRDRFPEKLVGIYTRRDFVNYAPQMNNWLPKFDGGWVASSADYGLKVYTLSWEDIANDIMKHNLDITLTRQDLWEYIDIKDWEPSNMAAWTKWSIWQYSGRIRYPSLGYPYDWQNDFSVFNGSLDDMYRWIKKSPPVDPPEPPVVDPTIEARLSTLETQYADLSARLTRLTAWKNKSL